MYLILHFLTFPSVHLWPPYISGHQLYRLGPVSLQTQLQQPQMWPVRTRILRISQLHAWVRSLFAVDRDVCSVSTNKKNHFKWAVCLLACDCSAEGSRFSTCDPVSGQCVCHPNVVGQRCDRCSPGSYDFPLCQGDLTQRTDHWLCPIYSVRIHVKQ